MTNGITVREHGRDLLGAVLLPVGLCCSLLLGLVPAAALADEYDESTVASVEASDETSAAALASESDEASEATAEGLDESLAATAEESDESPAGNIAEGVSGNCVWYITNAGELVIAPQNGVEGTLGTWEIGDTAHDWLSARNAIKTARFVGTVHAQTCSSFFQTCSNLHEVNLTGLDTSDVDRTSYMFQGCQSLTKVDLSGIDASNILSTQWMFSGCSSLVTLDTSGFRAPYVSSASGMFSNCSSLKTLDLSGLSGDLWEFKQMFAGCKSLTSLDISGMNISYYCNSFREMFAGCTSLSSFSIGEGFVATLVEMDGSLFSRTIVPTPTSSNGRWWSVSQRRWMTVGEIEAAYSNQSNRAADTFLNYQPAVSFSDVSGSTPHVRDILWLADAGISTGWPMPGGTREFRGMGDVLRQDMAAFLYRLAGKPAYEPSAADKARFRDVSDQTPHAKEIWWLASAGISTGWKEKDGSRTFRGTETVKRQDMAAFLRRLAQRQGVGTALPAGYQNPFSDVDASTPHREDVLWLASAKVSGGWTVGGRREFRGMSNVKRQDMAAFLHRLDGLQG